MNETLRCLVRCSMAAAWALAAQRLMVNRTCCRHAPVPTTILRRRRNAADAHLLILIRIVAR